jgi:hypothetical protein
MMEASGGLDEIRPVESRPDYPLNTLWALRRNSNPRPAQTAATQG